jgi:hypothetical protein
MKTNLVNQSISQIQSPEIVSVNFLSDYFYYSEVLLFLLLTKLTRVLNGLLSSEERRGGTLTNSCRFFQGKELHS